MLYIFKFEKSKSIASAALSKKVDDSTIEFEYLALNASSPELFLNVTLYRLIGVL